MPSFLSNNPITREINRDRIFGLDILRAAAIIFTLFGHAALTMPHSVQKWTFTLIPVDPVNLFFVLSGFLIGRILIKDFTKNGLTAQGFGKFWFKRWMRTLPAYFCVLIILAYFYGRFSIEGLKSIARYVIFVQNFAWDQPEFFTESWSLSIEEWFYLLIPIFILLFSKLFKADVRKAIFATAISFIIFFLFYRVYKFYNMPPWTGHKAWEYAFRMQVTTRLDSIMYGVLGAYLSINYREYWTKYKGQAAIIGLVFILSTKIADTLQVEREALYSSAFSFTLQCFGVMLTLPFFDSIKAGKGKVVKAVTFISVISYSLYLLNFALIGSFVMNRINHYGGTSLWHLTAHYLTFWILSIAAATILYVVIEHPFLLLRDKILKRNAITQLPK